MLLRVLPLILLLSSHAMAQQTDMHQHVPMDHSAMHGSTSPSAPAPTAGRPTQPGQSAFAAIQEIVALLEADPSTDWSKVDIEALRQHLVDMSRVTLEAAVAAAPTDFGLRFTVTGEGPVRESIRRMVTAHAATMDGVGGWRFAAKVIDTGAELTVAVPPADLQKLRGLGFIGVTTRGMHHQEHHMMLARGEQPHH
jgi:hypothetical protein